MNFNQIPSSLRIPFTAIEFDSSAANQGSALLKYRALIIGQKTSAGTGTADALYKITNPNMALTLGGRGSCLHRQAIAWFKGNKETELWIGVLADDGAGVKAAGTITVTGPATADGTIVLYLGGERVTVGVDSGDVQNDIATAIGAAINANLDLAVVATVATNVVTVTHRHKGAFGNAFDLRANYREGEALPTGVALAFVQLTSGATNPVLTGLIAAMGDMWFQIITHPYTDATSLTAIEAEMASRNGPMRMIDGVAFTAAQGSHSSLVTLGDGRNSPSGSIVGPPGLSPPTPAGEFAADCAAAVAKSAAADPARPFQTLPLAHTLPPAEATLFTNEERNLLLFDGIATTKVGPGGVVQLERMITTYQENSAAADDTAYLDVTTVLTLLYLRYSFRTRMLQKYPRHKLADDTFIPGPGQFVMTPKLGKLEAIGWFRDMGLLALVENPDDFKANLVVVRSDLDPNRLEFLLPPDLINQLIVTAAQIQFRL